MTDRPSPLTALKPFNDPRPGASSGNIGRKVVQVFPLPPLVPITLLDWNSVLLGAIFGFNLLPSLTLRVTLNTKVLEFIYTGYQ